MASMNVGGSSSGGKSSKLTSKFDNKRSSAQENHPNAPPIPEGNAWKTVDHTKPRTTEKPTLRPLNGNRHSPPSAAANSRRHVYETPAKPNSLYKQSLLPPDQRDPALVEAEANKGKSFLKAQYKPGWIIRGLLHEQDYNATSTGSNITVTDRFRSETKFGPVYTKYRKMIVLAMFEDHYLAIPLFTHNGNGLAYKSRPDEFIGIKDHRARAEEGLLQQQSRHEPLVTEAINSGIHLFDVKSTAHVTYALSRKYDLPVILEGQLTRSSINRLIRLFNQFAPTELKDRQGKVIH